MAIGQAAFQAAAMLLAQRRRNDQIGELLTHNAGAGAGEHFFRSRIEFIDVPPGVDGDDGVQARVENGAFACLAFPQGPLGLLARADILEAPLVISHLVGVISQGAHIGFGPDYFPVAAIKVHFERADNPGPFELVEHGVPLLGLGKKAKRFDMRQAFAVRIG